MTYIQPVPHAVALPERPGVRARICAWWQRPSRAYLVQEHARNITRIATLVREIAAHEGAYLLLTADRDNCAATLRRVRDDAHRVVGLWKAEAARAAAARIESDHGWALALVEAECWRNAYVEGVTPAVTP